MQRLTPSLVAISFLAAASLPAWAHGPTPQKVDESVTIKADPKAVWAIAGDYSGISKWDAILKASEGDNKKRILTFQNSEKLEEEVDEYDPEKMTYTYRMLEPNLKALPASSYSATLVVTPGPDGGSVVEWYGRVYRGDTGNEPADELNDDAARNALGTLFRTGLEGIKSKAEGRD
ncbi:MxaD protein [Labrys sp. WJW]|uniref:SRPBCC family protein n=1 Tax=Labrys sp. WJW TaxID=1737983 RepID=UPI00083363A2|nr:SRPBCC family protein [Labrys sp. WJW]OCC05476.1 MxaD protein [Labrys sp. WJW]